MQRNRLFAIFLVVFIDLLGFGLILPLLPFYADEFGASEFVIGLLAASYPAMQMVGAPILGRLSDRYGRRPILLVSLLGTALGYVMLGVAGSIAMLFASRMLDGLTGGNISVAQAYITDVTTNEDRAKGLGMIGAAFGLGFIFGPAIGGALSQFGFAVPAFSATALALISFLAVLFYLPESLTEAQKTNTANQPKRAILDISSMVAAIGKPRVGTLLIMRTGFGLAFGFFQSIFSLWGLRTLGLSAQTTGYILAYVGVLIVLVQGVAIGRITARWRDSPLLIAAMSFTFLGLVVWAFSSNIPILLVSMVPLALGAGIFNTVINTALSKAVYPEEVGETLGLSASYESLTRVIAPTAAGWLLGALGASVPGLFGAGILLLLIPYGYQRLIANPPAPLPTRT